LLAILPIARQTVGHLGHSGRKSNRLASKAAGSTTSRAKRRQGAGGGRGRCGGASPRDEAAATILSLITGNPFVTGEVIIVDGGFSSVT